MKKRCTNSECRKWFVIDSVCPHCGKQYPRIRAGKKPLVLVDLLLIDTGQSKLRTALILHDRFEMSLHEAKSFLDVLPAKVATGITLQEADDLIELFRRVGATATVLSSSRNNNDNRCGVIRRTAHRRQRTSVRA